jgi:branched-chain amino acid transport system permease protein
MDINSIFLMVLTGLQIGALYALIALGLTLIFGTLGVVNFAHGALYLIAAYAAVLISDAWGFWLAVLLVPVILLAVGIVMERGLIQFFYDRPHTDQILVTFGLAIVAEEAFRWWKGSNVIPFTLPGWGSGQVLFYGWDADVPEAIPGLRIPMPFLEGFTFYPAWRLLLIAVAAISVLALFLLLRFTRFGLVVRAGMRDAEMLQFLGINIPQRFAIVFGLGALIAGIAGIFGGPVTQVSPAVGMALLIPSFLVVVIGGMGSMLGALVAAILLGMALSFTTGFAAEVDNPTISEALTALQQIVVYLVAVIVLLIRPRGLFGKTGIFE